MHTKSFFNGKLFVLFYYVPNKIHVKCQQHILYIYDSIRITTILLQWNKTITLTNSWESRQINIILLTNLRLSLKISNYVI